MEMAGSIPGDAVYSRLRLWVDRNHDGVSQTDELITLKEAGVFAIDLNYQETRRTDQFGNQFRYVARIWDAFGRSIPNCYDVILVAKPVSGGE
jgi:hypothetical protein